MNLEIGRDRTDQADKSEILNNRGVNARRGQLAYRFFETDELVGEDECIHGHITFHTSSVQKCHDLGKFGTIEIARPDPRIVPLETEIDSIRAILDGGDQAGPIACRSEQLGFDMRREPCLTEKSH